MDQNGLRGLSDEIYVIGIDGQTEAVFDANGNSKFFNILAGSENLGRVEPTASDLRITNTTLTGTKTGNNIIAETNVLVTGTAALKAGTRITLKPGFRAAEGCTFSGLIDSDLASTPERFYYIKDHLGSTRVTVKRAKEGLSCEVVSYDDYDPWGMQLDYRNSNFGMVNDKYKFTGKERDNGTNYDYFGARYYDSRIGRWLQVDPLADFNLGVSPCNYAMNNPLNLIDPDGRDTIYFASLRAIEVVDNYKPFYEVQNLGPWGWINAVGEFGNIYGVEYFQADGDWYRSKDIRISTPVMGIPPDIGLKTGGFQLGKLLLMNRRASLLTKITNPKLKTILKELYREGAKIGNGSTADALKYEIATGQALSKTGHAQKAYDYRRALINLWHNKGQLNAVEKRVVKELLLKFKKLSV